MRKFLSHSFALLPFVLIFFTSVCSGQTPQYSVIGGSVNNVFPFQTTSSNKVQWIYYNTDFPTAPSGTITTLYFKVGTPSTTTTSYTNFTIKMGSSTLTGFTTGPFITTGLTTVYSQTTQTFPVLTSGQWVAVTLQTPWYYNSGQNFIVEVSQTAYSGGFSTPQNNSVGTRRIYGSVTSTTGTANTGLADLGFDINPCNQPTGATASNITMTTADFSWNAVTGSQGYEYALTTTATPPASGTPTSALTYNATGLILGTNYWFYVRNKCNATSYSGWAVVPFATEACPTAGAPTIVTNIPGSVTFSWPGNTHPMLVGYQYAVTTSPALPTAWTNTNSLSATVNSLVPGTTYYAHVRSNCSANQGNDQYIQFVNPFPPCYAPATLSITGVNMHGAEIRWNKSTTFPAAQDYQYAVTTATGIPASPTTTTDTFYFPTGLVGGAKYYVWVRAHCSSTNYSSWVRDSFVTPTTCLNGQVPQITNVTANSANITWQNFPGIYGYEYFLNFTATPPPSGVPIVYNTLVPLNLASGTTYYFHLRVRCDTFNYSPWVYESFTTPAICTNTSAPVMTGGTATSASFSWTGVPGAQNYQYSVTTTNTPQPSNTYTNTTNATAIFLNPNTSYYFHVRALCSQSDSSGWESVAFNTYQTSIGATGNPGFNINTFPNPIKDLLRIEVQGEVSGKGTLIFYDMSGRIVKEATVVKGRSEIDLSSLSQGFYMMRYRDNEHSGIMKLKKL